MTSADVILNAKNSLEWKNGNCWICFRCARQSLGHLPVSGTVTMIEWCLFILLLGCGLVPLYWKRSRWPGWFWAAVFVTAFLALSAGAVWNLQWDDRTRRQEDRSEHIPQQIPHDSYVTSDSCKSCHPGPYQSWHRSFHRTMTQMPTEATVRADFDNVTLELRGETYQFEKRGDEFWVDMPDPDWKAQQSQAQKELDWNKLGQAPRVKKPVSLVTGSHTLQKFWVSSEFGNLQYDLPFTWLIEDQRWVAREDSIVRDPNLPLLVQVWNLNCIKCHTTGPQPRRDPHSGKLGTRVGEMGISCEACHGPAQQHVAAHREPIFRYQQHAAENSDVAIVNPAKLPHDRSSQVCGQCHAIKISLEQDWEQKGLAFRPGQNLTDTMAIVQPGRPSPVEGLAEAMKESEVVEHFFWSDGMTRIAGREYNGLLQTPCYERGTMSCLSCHSIHKSDPNDQLARGMQTNESCLQCHESFRTHLQEHTHHAPDSSGSLCYNCHMPHTTWGLLKAIRSHQITSPTVQSSLATGRPNACNLCHLDQTLAWTSAKLSEWYNTPVPALSADEQSVASSLLWGLKGEAGQRALIAWHLGWEPAHEAAGTGWMPPLIAQLLDDPYAAVRYRAGKALSKMPQPLASVPFDFVGDASERKRASEEVLARWVGRPNTPQPGPGVLIGPNGQLQRDRFDALLRQRNQRSVFLVE